MNTDTGYTVGEEPANRIEAAFQEAEEVRPDVSMQDVLAELTQGLEDFTSRLAKRPTPLDLRTEVRDSATASFPAYHRISAGQRAASRAVTDAPWLKADPLIAEYLEGTNAAEKLILDTFGDRGNAIIGLLQAVENRIGRMLGVIGSDISQILSILDRMHDEQLVYIHRNPRDPFSNEEGLVLPDGQARPRPLLVLPFKGRAGTSDISHVFFPELKSRIDAATENWRGQAKGIAELQREQTPGLTLSKAIAGDIVEEEAVLCLTIEGGAVLLRVDRDKMAEVIRVFPEDICSPGRAYLVPPDFAGLPEPIKNALSQWHIRRQAYLEREERQRQRLLRETPEEKFQRILDKRNGSCISATQGILSGLKGRCIFPHPKAVYIEDGELIEGPALLAVELFFHGDRTMTLDDYASHVSQEQERQGMGPISLDGIKEKRIPVRPPHDQDEELAVKKLRTIVGSRINFERRQQRQR
ncbi:hypothetical protein ACFL11_01180 [Patescibacteria group bacterium]